MSRARQPVSIDGINFDALISETQSFEADVPSYPTEAGFEISDTIILKPLSLSMTLYLTNTPVTWKAQNGVSQSRVQDVLKRLKELYFKKIPVTVSTTDQIFRNMAIQSIELTKSVEAGTSREIPISFREIRITESETTTIPDSYGKSGVTGANAGTASTAVNSVQVDSSAEESGSKGSILHGIASGTGLLSEGGLLGGLGGLFGGAN